MTVVPQPPTLSSNYVCINGISSRSVPSVTYLKHILKCQQDPANIVMVHLRQVANEVRRDLTWRWVCLCHGDLPMKLLIPFAGDITPPPSDKAKERSRSNSTERREDVWQDRINNNIPHRDLRFNQANLPPAGLGLGDMLNASMRRRPPVPPPTDFGDEEEDEEENDNPPLSSSTVKLPMNYQKEEYDEGNELDNDDNVCISYDGRLSH